MLAKASPRKPYVPMEVRSSKALSLEVVKRSHKIGRSSFLEMSAYDDSKSVHTYIDAVSVIGNLQQLEAAVFDQDF
jgi:hypothetical protein